MKEQVGTDYVSSKYLKMLAAADAKMGKTTFLAASCLGVLPWQKHGGLVTRPEHLHIVTFDANALGGLKEFVVNSCGKPEAYTRFSVYNLQAEVRKPRTSEWDFSLYNAVIDVADRIKNKAAKGGVHAVMASSLTGLAVGIQRGIAGPPSFAKKGSGMDQSKWQSLAEQLSEIQNVFQEDLWHMFWEAHIDKGPEAVGRGDAPKETIQVTGKAGRYWAFNTEQNVRLRRESGIKVGLVDRVYMDTRPSADFMGGGRMFTEKLEAKEYDLVSAAMKLGVEVGHMGKKKEAA